MRSSLILLILILLVQVSVGAQENCHYSCTNCVGVKYYDCLQCDLNRELIIHNKQKQIGSCECSDNSGNSIMNGCVQQSWQGKLLIYVTYSMICLCLVLALYSLFLQGSPNLIITLIEFSQNISLIVFMDLYLVLDLNDILRILWYASNPTAYLTSNSDLRIIDKAVTFSSQNGQSLLEEGSFYQIGRIYQTSNIYYNIIYLIALLILILIVNLVAYYCKRQQLNQKQNTFFVKNLVNIFPLILYLSFFELFFYAYLNKIDLKSISEIVLMAVVFVLQLTFLVYLDVKVKRIFEDLTITQNNNNNNHNNEGNHLKDSENQESWKNPGKDTAKNQKFSKNQVMPSSSINSQSQTVNPEKPEKPEKNEASTSEQKEKTPEELRREYLDIFVYDMVLWNAASGFINRHYLAIKLLVRCMMIVSLVEFQYYEQSEMYQSLALSGLNLFQFVFLCMAKPFKAPILSYLEGAQYLMSSFVHLMILNQVTDVHKENFKLNDIKVGLWVILTFIFLSYLLLSLFFSAQIYRLRGQIRKFPILQKPVVIPVKKSPAKQEVTVKYANSKIKSDSRVTPQDEIRLSTQEKIARQREIINVDINKSQHIQKDLQSSMLAYLQAHQQYPQNQSQLVQSHAKNHNTQEDIDDSRVELAHSEIKKKRSQQQYDLPRKQQQTKAKKVLRFDESSLESERQRHQLPEHNYRDSTQKPRSQAKAPLQTSLRDSRKQSQASTMRYSEESNARSALNENQLEFLSRYRQNQKRYSEQSNNYFKGYQGQQPPDLDASMDLRYLTINDIEKSPLPSQQYVIKSHEDRIRERREMIQEQNKRLMKVWGTYKYDPSLEEDLREGQEFYLQETQQIQSLDDEEGEEDDDDDKI